MHLRFIAVSLAVIAPLAVHADQGGPLAPAALVQLEGGIARPNQGVAQAQEPPASAQQPLPPVPITQLDNRQTHPVLDGPPLNLSLADPTPIRDVLFALVEGTNVSVLPDPAIADVTWVGDLKGVTVREALDLILEPLGLDYSIRGNIIRVFERELETRLFPIDYVITTRGGSRGMSASSGASGAASAAGGGGTGGTGGAATGATGGAAGGASGGGGGSGGSSASVGGSDAPDFFGGLENAVEQLLSPDGTFTLDRTAGLMRVTDSAARLDRVAQYLEAVMLRVTRQVRLEARVIEVTLNESFSAGINWNAIIGSLSKYVSIGQTLTGTGGGFTITGNVNDDFGAVMTAFSQQGNARVLSSPSFITLNNQPAIINAGTQEVFFNTTTQRDPQGIVTQSTVTPQSLNVGVVLSATPQISADGTIMLSLNPSVTELAGSATSRLGDVVPRISQRTTDTIVRVREGETIVIAGLMQDKETTTNSSVPVLGSLPVIGAAFRSKSTTKTKTDLVIMLTPTLINPSEVVYDTAREIRRVDTAQRANEKRR